MFTCIWLMSPCCCAAGVSLGHSIFPFPMKGSVHAGVPALLMFIELSIQSLGVPLVLLSCAPSMEQPGQLATPEETFATLQSQFEFSALITTNILELGCKTLSHFRCMLVMGRKCQSLFHLFHQGHRE